MPRYFFHIQDSEEFIDTVGTELADAELVRRTATRTAAEILREEDSLWNGKLWRMRVTDEAGNTVLTLEFIASVETGAK
jgi:hypothetical protein